MDQGKEAIKKRRNYFFRLTGLVFACLMIIFIIWNIVSPDRPYSASERRQLRTPPKLSLASLMDGSYGEALEAYLADQFPARDIWVYMDSLKNLVMGQRYSQGVYKCKDSYLIEAFTEPKQENTERTLNSLQSFLQEYPDVDTYIMLVPTAAWILEDKLPVGAVTAKESEWYETWEQAWQEAALPNVRLVSPADALTEAAKSSQIYYRTDHHWTTFGAFTAFQVLAEQMELPFQDDTWHTETVHSNFQGTLMSKSGFYLPVKDDVTLYLPDREISVVVSYAEEHRSSASLYSSDGLAGNDPYEVFLGGNYPLVNIQTTAKSDRKLLILKDSYANSFVGFLCPYFAEIDMVDPRYYSGDVRQLLNIGDYTDICILYNVGTFSQDISLSQILEREMP